MTTQNFNRHKAKSWLKRLNKDKSRLWLTIGMKRNGHCTVIANKGTIPLKIAATLESIANTIRNHNIDIES